MDMLSHPWPLAIICFAAGLLLARVMYRRGTDAAAPARGDISDAEIETELRAGRKIEAINLYRQKNGCDLKTAMDEINAMTANLGLRT
jgi:hypothetical protein